MDGLALLCTLYGDGPVTLRRLREAGWDTVDRLEARGTEALAEAIGLPLDQARRLQREARGLLERIDGFSEAPLPSIQDGGDVSSPLSEAIEAEAPATAPPTRVVAHGVVALDDGPRGVLIPHRPEPPAVLAVGTLDGLDDAVLRALARAGVTTLAQLVAAEEVELVRATGLPLTRLLRLRFLAKRLGPARPAATAERFSPSERGTSQGFVDEPPTGGPFA